MDRFDRISVIALAALCIVAGTLMIGRSGASVQERQTQVQASAVAALPPPGDLVAAVRIVRTLLESGSLVKAEALVSELKQKYPYQGEPRMLMGDLLMRRQEPVRAMHEYREAIELNPDYLDKKTPLFQGKKLKVAVGEALAVINKQLEQNPGNEPLRKEKKTVYYFYRRIAGSCG